MIPLVFLTTLTIFAFMIGISFTDDKSSPETFKAEFEGSFEAMKWLMWVFSLFSNDFVLSSNRDSNFFSLFSSSLILSALYKNKYVKCIL